jgi:hypothetical protein
MNSKKGRLSAAAMRFSTPRFRLPFALWQIRRLPLFSKLFLIGIVT